MAKTNPSAPASSKAAPSAAPGAPGDTKAKKAKKDAVAKTAFLAEGDAKLTHNDERLANYSAKTHKKLKPSDFTTKSEAMRFRALAFDRAAARLRNEADQFDKMGAIVDNKKAKRLLALSAQIEALKSSLAEEGQDVTELLKSMGITG